MTKILHKKIKLRSANYFDFAFIWPSQRNEDTLLHLVITMSKFYVQFMKIVTTEEFSSRKILTPQFKDSSRANPN